VNETDFDALDDQIESESSGTNNDDYRELPWVNVTPRIAIAGTVTDLGSFCDVEAEQNIRGGGMGGDVVVTLDDPEVLLGDVFENRSRSAAGELVRDTFADDRDVSSVDYRVVDADDQVIGEHVEQVDGEYTQTGITYYDNPYRSNQREDVRDDEAAIEVLLKSHAGQLVFQALHAGPAIAAFEDDADSYADHNGGAVEFPPNYTDEDYSPDDDGYPRIASSGVLHPDLEGERIIVYMKWGDATNGNRKHIGHVLWDRGEDSLTEMTNLVTEDPLDPAMDVATDAYTFLVWDEPDGVNTPSPDASGDSDDTDTGGGAGGAAPSGGSGGSAFDALDDQIEDTTGGGGGGADPTSYADLADTDQQFIDEVVDTADGKGVGPDELLGGEFEAAWTDAVDGGEIDGSTDSATALQIARTKASAVTA